MERVSHHDITWKCHVSAHTANSKDRVAVSYLHVKHTMWKPSPTNNGITLSPYVDPSTLLNTTQHHVSCSELSLKRMLLNMDIALTGIHLENMYKMLLNLLNCIIFTLANQGKKLKSHFIARDKRQQMIPWVHPPQLETWIILDVHPQNKEVITEKNHTPGFKNKGENMGSYVCALVL